MIMRFLGAIGFALSFSLTANAGYTVKWDLEDNRDVTLFSKPGLDYYRCLESMQAKTGCKNEDKIAFPNKDAKIDLVLDRSGRPESFYREEVHPYYKNLMGETWFKVRVKYTNRIGQKIEKEGWIEESFLDVRNESEPQRPKQATTKSCPADCSQKTSKSEMSNSKNLESVAIALKEGPISEHKKRVGEVATALSMAVGECTYSPPLTDPKKNWSEDRPIYDQEVLPLIKKHEKQLPLISASAKKNVSMNQLIEIDMLARTIYGEMAKCHDKGLQYLDAVAKVAVNRAEFDSAFRSVNSGTASEFTNSSLRQRPDATAMMKVLSSAYQFNPWDLYLPSYEKNPKTGKKQKVLAFNESGLSQALCPPASANVFWGTHLPAKKGIPPVPSRELEIWKDVLNIATEAVLFPKEFESRTSDVDSLFFQSQVRKKQNMSRFQKRDRIVAKIEDRAIKNNWCVALYKNKPGQQKLLDKAKSELMSK